MLEVNGIHTYYGLKHILFGVSLTIKRGEVVCLLGRNGAGKTTTMKSIIGVTPPQQGSIRFKDYNIAGKEPYMLTRKGISYVPDDRRIFADLTVGENLEIAIQKTSAGRGWNKESVYKIFPALKEMELYKGGYLSGGEQKMLAVARAMMGNPELLLLDEPTEGLAPMMVYILENSIQRLKEAGLTILLAEQNVRSALRLSDRAYIIDNGKICFHGTIEELKANKKVQKKYLLL